jgi:hypothetical protein
MIWASVKPASEARYRASGKIFTKWFNGIPKKERRWKEETVFQLFQELADRGYAYSTPNAIRNFLVKHEMAQDVPNPIMQNASVRMYMKGYAKKYSNRKRPRGALGEMTSISRSI